MLGWRVVLLLVVAIHGVSCQVLGPRNQFAGGQGFFGNAQNAQNAQGAQLVTMTPRSTSSSTFDGSLQSPKTSSSNDASSRIGSVSSDVSSSSGSSEGSASEASGDDSGSGGWIMGSGSGSSSMEYGCNCRSVRRVSLMGASDYCLAPESPLSSKCGNVDLGEGGACPTTGAQPCSPKGHVLANNSLCALDDKDETYKCVASKNDLDIQKHGKKKKKKSGRHHGSGSSEKSEAPSELMLTARQVLAIVISVAAGVMAVV